MPSERMILTRIAVDRGVWFLGKCRFNLSLRRLGNELVLFGQMHEKGRTQPTDLSQIFLSIAAVISDRGSRRGLRSRYIGGERAVMSFYGDVIFHWVLLRRPRSSGPPLMPSGSAEACSRAVTVQSNRTPSSHAKSFTRD